MSGQQISPHYSDDDIDFLQLLRLIWAKRLTIALAIGLGLAGAILYLHMATYSFTATLKVVPVEKNNSSVSSKLGGLAGLATVAGINLPQDAGSSYFQLYVAGYKTRRVARVLAADPLIMQQLYRSEWVESSRQFQEPKSFSSHIKKWLKNSLGVPVYPWRHPDAARLQEFITKNVIVVQDKKSPIVTVMFNYKDPVFAAYFLKSLHGAVDNELRMRAKTRASESIVYLSQQLATETLAEHRQAISQSLSEQVKLRMMASSKLSFSAEPLEDPTASIRPTNPKPLIILSGGLFLGLCLGLLFVYIQYQLALSRAKRPSAL